MKIATLALLLIALVQAGARAQERAPWRLGAPEVVWRYAPGERGGWIATVALHPDGGFVVVAWRDPAELRVHRFRADWAALWQQDLLVPTDAPDHGTQRAHVAILPTGHIALASSRAIALLDADGRVAWIRTAGRIGDEELSGFTRFGALVPIAGGVLVGGYGEANAEREPICWRIQAMVARLGLDGRMIWQAAYRRPWRGGLPWNGTPFDAVPLAARPDGGALAYVDSASLWSDFGMRAGAARGLSGERCRGGGGGRVLEIDSRGRIRAHRPDGAALAALRRRYPELPRHALVDAALGVAGHQASDPVLLWLGPESWAVYDLTIALREERSHPPEEPRRRQAAVAIVTAVAAASLGEGSLVLLRSHGGDAAEPLVPRSTDGALRHALVLVTRDGARVVDERIMEAVHSVRLMPQAGVAYGFVENTVVRFALREPAR